MLTKERHVNEEVFGVLWCPFCGNQSFVESRFDGVYCAGCGASVSIAPSELSDTEIVAHFDASTCEYRDGRADIDRGPTDWVTVEIEDMENQYAVKFIDCGDTETDWEPKQPGYCVKPLDGAPNVPHKRWV
jgi:hypothetical protein